SPCCCATWPVIPHRQRAVTRPRGPPPAPGLTPQRRPTVGAERARWSRPEGAARLPAMPRHRRPTRRPPNTPAVAIRTAPFPSGPAEAPLAPADLQARVLHRDGLILVIDKPAGLPVH